MGDTSGIRAGRAYVELGIGDKMSKGLNLAKARLASFGKGMTSWGSKLAVAAGALSGPAMIAAHSFASAGNQIAKVSQRTGMSTEAVSELGFAAEVAGADMGTLEAGIHKMQKTAANAAKGSKTAAKALATVGLSAKDLADLDPESQFTLIAEAVSRIDDPTKRAAAAMAIFGRGGVALLPMMNKGAEGIAKVRDEARELGLSMSGKDAQDAEVLTNAFHKVERVGKSIFRAIGAALAPTLKDLADRAVVIGIAVRKWADENRGLIGSVLQIAMGVAAFGTGLIVAGKAIEVFAIGLGMVASIVGVLLSPITLVLAAVGGLTAAFLLFTDSGGKALGWLSEGFATLKDDVSAAWGGIAAALAAGDIEGAAKVLWATLKLEWARGINALTTLWVAFRDSFSDIMSSLGPILMEVGRRLVASLGITRYATPGYGSVDYTYRMGKFEVTAGQYTTFLNAVGGVDTYALYNGGMADTGIGSGITRSGGGTLGNPYTYTVAADFANRPVNYVSWGDSVRFANWLTNGHPTGAQGPLTTEDGAYHLAGAVTDAALMAVVVPSAAQRATWSSGTKPYFLVPSEDEWYKAAYYKGGGTNAGYWDYPTSSNTAPGRDMADVSDNNANIYGTPYPIDSGKFTTVVGEFQNSDSPYGTFDQGGNVWEWNEANLYGPSRGLRGGSFNGPGSGLHASYRDDYGYGHYFVPTYESDDFGFRVSEVPEPATLALLALGGLAMLRGRGRAR